MRRTLSGASRAAIGSTLLRSPGSNSPLQYDFSGSIRSACPAAFARPSIYAAKRFSCGPGAEGLVPTKQFYTNLFLYNTVVLGAINTPCRGGSERGAGRAGVRRHVETHIFDVAGLSLNVAHNAAGRDCFLHPASAARAVRSLRRIRRWAKASTRSFEKTKP